MAFSNQFTLSLELTRLLPPFGRAATKAGNAIMNRARELRHSGSDIVVEEDLANVFGRCRISLTLTSSFKTVITKSTSNISLLEGIMLQGGPGPTVVRAFQESPYFAMVVQLSLLMWIFDANYLATALADALRKRLEGAPSSTVWQSSPDRLGILGVLRACESQTSAFNWNMMIHAVSATLGYPVGKAPIDFPPFVLQGLLDMFPSVQSLPNDRIIHIQIPVGIESGIVTLIVWAHHVLDLAVLVRPHQQQGQSRANIRYGSSDMEQVFIEEVAAEDEPSIILLDSQKEPLLAIKPEPDEERALIGSVQRIPARGWGNVFLAEYMESWQICRTRSQAVLEDLQVVTSAFAFVIAKNLVRDDNHKDYDEVSAERNNELLYSVDEQRLLQSSRFLFDNPGISPGQIKSYVLQYSFKTLDERLPRPPALDAAAREYQPPEKREILIEDEWNQICFHARSLSILIIALAHTVDLDECENLTFPGVALQDMSEHALAQQLEDWNGRDSLRIQDDAWLQAVSIPLLGPRNQVWRLPWSKVCLTSARGWSAWIPTFGDLDPAYMNAGSVRLAYGRPCRNGVWKDGIWDSPRGALDFHTDPARAESCGQAAYLRCTVEVNMETPYCGEGEDVFVVCARMRLHKSVVTTRPLQLLGYKQLHKCLWCAHLTKHCPHTGRMTENIKLAVGCATVTGFGNYLEETEERILIYLTAHNVGARWLALGSVSQLSVLGDREEDVDYARQILLRKNDCCFQCAIDQAAAQRGKWFIIL